MLIHLLDPTNPPQKRLARCGLQLGLMTESQGTVPDGSAPGAQQPLVIGGVGKNDGLVHRMLTSDSGEVLVVAEPADAGPWVVARTLVAQVAEPGPPAATVVTGAVDLTGYVYPGAFDNTSITVNAATLTFAPGDPVSEVAMLAALNAAFPDVLFDIDLVGGRFLRLTYAGNLVLAGSLLAVAGIAAATYGGWTDLGAIAPVLEVSYASLVVAGAPDSVLLRVWRQVGAVVDCIGQVFLDPAALDVEPSHRFSCDAQAVTVTVDFTGGAGPTLAGTILVRIAQAGAEPTILEQIYEQSSAVSIRTEWTAVASVQSTSNLVPTTVGGIPQLDPSLTRGGTFRFLATVYATAGRQVTVQLYNVDDATVVAGTSFTTAANSPTVVSATLSPGVTVGFPSAPRQYEVRIYMDGGVFPDAVFCQGALVENVV